MNSVIKCHQSRRRPKTASYLFSTISQEELASQLLGLFQKTTLSVNSQKQFSLKLAQWVHYLTEEKTLHHLISNPSSSFDVLCTVSSISHSHANHHIYISSVVSYLTHLFPSHPCLDQWKALQKHNSLPLAEHYLDHKPTVLQKDKVVSYDHLIAVLQSLPIGSYERLLLAFYTLIEPLRADYYATKIFFSSSDTEGSSNNCYACDNYILIDKDYGAATLYVNDFKTKGRHGTIVNPLSSELINELRNSLTMSPRSYLFVCHESGLPFNRKLFSNWACRTLSRILKQPMTLTALRHIYISHFIKNSDSDCDKGQLLHIASKMGHSRSMQVAYSWS
jgi:hypothetical protein